MYQIAHLGDDDDEPEFSSAMPLEEGDTFFFAPRALKNLVMVDELHSYAPILGELLRSFLIFFRPLYATLMPPFHVVVSAKKNIYFLVKGIKMLWT